MTTPLFATYRQGENRVTATFLSVLQRLSLPNIDRVLRALLEDTDFSLVTFVNQPKGPKSKPDGRIETGHSILIETKTSLDSVDHDQIQNHLAGLRDGESLLLLTPDYDKPKNLSDLSDRVVWSNFRTLADVVRDILDDEDEPPSEREAFLLREFISMLRTDGLLSSASSRVLVVAARKAWPLYQQFNVYWCQPNRSFRPSGHIAFYANGQIQPIVAKIKAEVESIDPKQQEQIDDLDGELKKLAEELREQIICHRQQEPDAFSESRKVIFLTGPKDRETITLPGPVTNDHKDKNGNPTPFTYGAARYVTLESLKEARTTSDLDLC